MSREIQAELAEMVRYHSSEHGRTCILVGMHLCGLLSEKAIEFFARMPEVRGLVLSPCCLPRRHEQGAATRFVKAQRGAGAGRWRGSRTRTCGSTGTTRCTRRRTPSSWGCAAALRRRPVRRGPERWRRRLGTPRWGCPTALRARRNAPPPSFVSLRSGHRPDVNRVPRYGSILSMTLA